MLLLVDEAEEHVLQVEADEIVLDDGEITVGGEAGHGTLDGRGLVGLDADDVAMDVAVTADRLDRDRARDGREVDGDVLRSAEGDRQAVPGEALEELAGGRRPD